MKIRAIIIDDEPHAREGLRIRLQDYSGIEIIEECSSGYDAIEKINLLTPDLIFLDIQMPGMNGFEVLKNIDDSKMPAVIFVTAYDEYALKAFEFHAIDYLLKPVDKARLKKAIDYAIDNIVNKNVKLYSKKLRELADEYLKIFFDKYRNEEKYLDKISIRTKDIIRIISISEILWIEALGDYVYLHCNEEKYLLRNSLTALEKKLNPEQFVRIHRSSIVNVEYIEKLKPNEHGDYEVYLKNGTKIKLSRNYKENIQRILGENF